MIAGEFDGIYRINSQTGEYIKIAGTAEGAKGPSDVRHMPDGSLVFTNPFTGEVYSLKEGISRLLGTIPGAVFGAVPCAGGLYVTSTAGVFEIDTLGVKPPRLVTNERFGLEQCGCVGDRLIAPDTYSGSGEVVAVNLSTGGVEVIASGFPAPLNVRENPANADEIYVLDYSLNAVIAVDIHTQGSPP